MHALQNAFSNVSPWFCSRVIPGRFTFAQSRGKCWIARSWSVMNMMMFLPANPVPRPCGAPFCAAAVPPPSITVGAAIAADCSNSLRLSTVFTPSLRPFATICHRLLPGAP